MLQAIAASQKTLHAYATGDWQRTDPNKSDSKNQKENEGKLLGGFEVGGKGTCLKQARPRLPPVGLDLARLGFDGDVFDDLPSCAIELRAAARDERKMAIPP